MASFGGLILTNKGRALQAKAQSGVPLVYTRIAIGDGNLAGQQITNLTNLINLKKSLPITDISIQPGYDATIHSYLSNGDITTGFFFRELGLFATDPTEGEILYSYGNSGAGAEYIPSGGGPDIVEKFINAVAIVGNAANVSAIINESLIYANLMSPAFTGTPTAPTPALGTNTAQLATAAFVQAAISALVNSSPAALDTLQELATALGNDPNFATTITNALAQKAPLISPSLQGIPTAPTAALGTNTTQLATLAFVKAAIDAIPPLDTSSLAPKNNPTFTGTVTLPADPSSSLHAATKQWVDAQIAIAKTYAP